MRIVNELNPGNGRKYISDQLKYLLILLLLALGYYAVFVRSVIPPQTGWWQYMGWRMTEGDLPYRDFFLFLPPYFAIFSEALYTLFGHQMIYYTIFGILFTRVLLWCIIYKVLAKRVHPQYAMIATLTGICMNSSYLMDQVYDYNPVVIVINSIMAWLLFALYDEKNSRKEFLYVTSAGLIAGILMMTKQTVGIVMPIICLGLIVVICKLKENQCIWKYLSFYVTGIIIGIIPGVIYLTINGIWQEFWDCITIATSAKVGTGSLILVTIKNFLSRRELAIACLVLCCYLYFRADNNKHRNFFISISLLLGVLLVLLDAIAPSLKNASNALHGMDARNVILIGLWMLSAVVALLVSIIYQYKYEHINIITKICLIGFIALSIIFSVVSPLQVKWFLLDGINFITVRRILLLVILYLDIIIWLRAAYDIFYKKRRENISYFFPFTLSLIYVGIGFSSSGIEELYAVLFVPAFIAYILEKNEFSDKIGKVKNIFIITVSIIVCILSLSQKIFIPYEWHSWRTPPLYDRNNPMISSQVPGLEGFILPKSDEEAYRNIVSLIERHSNSEDIMYQFPNVSLFNVLTERKSIYDAVAYFDVLPDVRAKKSAEMLYENPPEIVLWSEMSEWRWKIHEDIFRSGSYSGQREIQKWHNEYVAENYRRIGIFDNNEGGGEYIAVYKWTPFSGGLPRERVTITSKNNTWVQKARFSEDEFSKYLLYIPNDVRISPYQKVRITLQDKDMKKVHEVTGILKPEEDNYYQIELNGPQRVKLNSTYSIKVEFLSVKKPFEVAVTGYNSAGYIDGYYKYGEFNGKRMNNNLCITCE